MNNLDDLSIALRNTSQAKGRLSGLDEEYERAALASDSKMTGPNKYGYVSPLATIADVLRKGRGHNQMQALKGQRADARNTISANENAAALYGAGVAERAVETQKSQFETTTAAKLEAAKRLREHQVGSALKLATAKKLATGAPEMYVGADGTGAQAVYGTGDGAFTIDSEGNRTRADLSKQILQSEYEDRIEAQRGALEKKGLTPNQVRLELGALEKKLKPVENIQSSVTYLEKLIKKYSVGEEREGEDIGGIGGVQGWRGEGLKGHIGAAVRWADDATSIFGGESDSAEISNAVSSIIAPIIRDQAGLAQTLSETAKVIQSLGLQDISNEGDFLKALPQIKAAIRRDLARIERTTSAQAMSAYSAGSRGANAFFNETPDLKFTQAGDAPTPEGEAAPKGWSITEVK